MKSTGTSLRMTPSTCCITKPTWTAQHKLVNDTAAATCRADCRDRAEQSVLPVDIGPQRTLTMYLGAYLQLYLARLAYLYSSGSYFLSKGRTEQVFPQSTRPREDSCQSCTGIPASPNRYVGTQGKCSASGFPFWSAEKAII